MDDLISYFADNPPFEFVSVDPPDPVTYREQVSSYQYNQGWVTTTLTQEKLPDSWPTYRLEVHGEVLMAYGCLIVALCVIYRVIRRLVSVI